MAGTAATPSHLIALQEGGSFPPLFLVHGAGDDLAEFRELARLLGPDQPCFSFHLAGARTWRAMERVERLVAHYRRSMEPKIAGRPFFLAGYSFGGTVAYEMAVQLASVGSPPLALLLLDTFPPSAFRMAVGFKSREPVSWVTRTRRMFLRVLVAAGRPIPKRWARVCPDLRREFRRARRRSDHRSILDDGAAVDREAAVQAVRLGSERVRFVSARHDDVVEEPQG
jgi:thioesterase domain-containing protein